MEVVSGVLEVFGKIYELAETAKSINPNKKVILQDLKAGCS